MNPQDQSDAESRQLIEKWQGGDAYLWQYDVSLSRLIIRVTTKGRPGNLHIICLSTEFICGRVSWTNCSFEIQNVERQRSNSSHINYVLKDRAANFEVHCGLLGTQENVEPYV